MANKDWDKALRRIEKVRENGETDLSLTNLKIESLPPEIAGLTTLTYLDLDGTGVTDAGLHNITGMTGLQFLDLGETQVTDAGLPHIAGMTRLQHLYLDGTQITDSGLPHIAGLTKLQQLNLSGTQITDAGLPHIAGMTRLQRLSLDGTQITDSGLPHIAGLTKLQQLDLSSTQITDAGLPHIAGMAELEILDLIATQVKDLRLLLALPLLTEGPWEFMEKLLLNITPALSDPAVAAAMAQKEGEDQRKALLAHLRSLPKWPAPLPTSTQGIPAKDNAPRIFKKLTMRTAREMLEENYPSIRDRCQAVVAELDQGLAYHRLHIPNEDQSLDDHRQVEQALTYAKAMMDSVHDAVPEDFTDRPLSHAEVSRFRDALNGAVDQLKAASKYIDQPGHTPTYGGLLKLGCATAVGSVFALIPGVAVAYAIPAVFSALYGKDAVMKALASGK